MTTIVTSATAAKKLKFGEPFIIEPKGFDGPEHDALEFEEAYTKLSAEVEEIVAKIQPPEDIRETVVVEFTKEQAVITSIVDQTLEIGGDVRDATVEMEAQKPTKRKLNDEGNGFVSVNGQEFPTP